jgi:RimJ/RimL family protein N-acetyltransferase
MERMTTEDPPGPTLLTARLMLRRWRDDDVEPMAAINADPEVMRWIGSGAVRDLEQTRSGIAAIEREWKASGYGLFALEERASGDLLGFTGMTVPYFLPEVMPAVEIAWRLGRRYWGKGIATEASAAALGFGLVDRGLPRIIAIVQVGNDASERIMTKLGMRAERQTVDPSTGRALRVYEITRTGYLESRQDRDPG